MKSDTLLYPACKNGRWMCFRVVWSCQLHSHFSALLIVRLWTSNHVGKEHTTFLPGPQSLNFSSVHYWQQGWLSHLFIHMVIPQYSKYWDPSILRDSSLDTQGTPVLYFLQKGWLMAKCIYFKLSIIICMEYSIVGCLFVLVISIY